MTTCFAGRFLLNIETAQCFAFEDNRVVDGSDLEREAPSADRDGSGEAERVVDVSA